MTIITQHGRIDFDDLEQFDISIDTQDFLDSQEEAIKLFFGDEIDLTKLDLEKLEVSDEIIEELENCAVAVNKFENIDRAMALAKLLDESLTEIDESSYGTHIYNYGNQEYQVLTDEEATEEAQESIKNLLDDVGITGFSEHAQDYAFNNFVDSEWFDDYMHSSNVSYADDIESEGASDDIYLNRLHEEMVETGILSEPEWPDEDDFEGEVFDEEEPDEDDFENTEDYEEALENWQNAKDEFDENNDDSAYQDARDEYQSTLESEIENVKEEFADKLDDDYDDGIDYFKSNFGNEEFNDAVQKNNLLDEDAFVEWVVEQDGRGQSLNGYNGEEEEVTITYNGEELTFFIYRKN